MAEKAKSVKITDVANLAGVSVATVSRIVNGVAKKASPDTVRKVKAAIAELNYQPSGVGRALRRNKSHLIAMVIPDANNAFYAAVATSVETALRQKGYSMILCNSDENPDTQDLYLAEMRSLLVSGVALLGAVPSPELEKMVKSGFPVVFINRKAPNGLTGPFVGIDNYAAGACVAEQFISQGYTDCAAIHGPLQSPAQRDRYQGYVERLSREGIEIKQEWVRNAMLTIESGYSAASSLLTGPDKFLPRAIFCGNDPIAYGTYRRCQDLGLHIPKDIALFGFDDNPLNQWLAPWLSTIHAPYDSFGAAVLSAFERTWGNEPGAQEMETILPFSVTQRSSI